MAAAGSVAFAQSHKTHRPAKAHHANAAPAEHVTYSGGQLSVQSSGADLAVVLGAIQQATGMKITGVAAAQKQKLVGDFGPGDPAAVLAEVLDGTRLNYIFLKSQTDPKVIRSVMLFAPPAPQAQPPTVAPAPAALPANQQVSPAPLPPGVPRNQGSKPQAGAEPPDAEPAPQAQPPEANAPPENN